ncbi:hypothetical protein EYF80_032456 [Liparis tanakae]|uniref:Uncharacterized protein n=1 Tax=Liparis tanakae TaxID=230148 RepID=A0A4Z2GVX6_9TELE|nr:hypothetical protein EYF80_032456 [Liparis tanakae]
MRRFLRGLLSAGAPRARGAPASLALGLLPGEPLTPFNIQAKVHHVAFELFTWLLRGHELVSRTAADWDALQQQVW